MVKIGQAVSEKKTFKDYEILNNVYSQGARADKPRDKSLNVTKRVCYFDQFQPFVFNIF